MAPQLLSSLLCAPQKGPYELPKTTLFRTSTVGPFSGQASTCQTLGPIRPSKRRICISTGWKSLCNALSRLLPGAVLASGRAIACLPALDRGVLGSRCFPFLLERSYRSTQICRISSLGWAQHLST